MVIFAYKYVTFHHVTCPCVQNCCNEVEIENNVLSAEQLGQLSKKHGKMRIN